MRPAGSLTVLAGRAPPSAGWQLDLGWQRLTRVHELDRLDNEDSDRLLAGLGVAAPRRSTLARIGRGYPLVLAMLAEPTSGIHAEADLADVPLAVRGEAREDLGDREVEARERDAFDPDPPGRQVAHVVVVTDREGQRHLVHRDRP